MTKNKNQQKENTSLQARGKNLATMKKLSQGLSQVKAYFIKVYHTEITAFRISY